MTRMSGPNDKGYSRQMTSIQQAVRDAPTEQEIHRLVAAYAKATRIDDQVRQLAGLIPGVAPSEANDLTGRVRILFTGLEVASKRLDDDSRTAIKEALHLFCHALLRLNELQTVQPDGVFRSPPAGRLSDAHPTRATKKWNNGSDRPFGRAAALEEGMILPEARSLIGEKQWSRRSFVATVLASGFAAAVQPVSAQTITTDSKGLIAGVVKIPVADGQIPAYRAMPETGGPFPVVLVVQEIFGVHEHIKDLCRRLAKSGHFAVAPELYARQGDVSQLKDIQEILTTVVSKVPDAQVISDLDSTVAWASGAGSVDVRRLAITGFCWGGRITWLYCAHNPRVRAGVAWYGRLVGQPNALMPKNPIDFASTLRVPVLGLYGAADQGIPVQSVDEMRAALSRGTSGSELIVYPDTPHGFNADYRPSYRKEAAEDGWKRMLAWFSAHGAG